MIKVIQNMDSGTRKTPLCKSQQRSIGIMMRKIKHDEIKISHGHFFSYGFIRRGKTIVYFSTSDFRHFPNQAIVRYAENFKDFTGGMNNITTIEKLDSIVETLLSNSVVLR